MFTDATPSCLLLHQLHLFSSTQHGFISIQIVPLHVCYMFRPSSECQYKNLTRKSIMKYKGTPVYCLYFYYNVKTDYTKL